MRGDTKEQPVSKRQLSPHHGVVVPMVTPVTPGGNLDEPAVRRVIDHMVAGGVQGIFVLGTTGESTSAPAALHERLVALAVEHVGGRARVYAGIGSNCLADSVAAAAVYAPLGVDAVVAHLPTYYALNVEEQCAYFSALAGRIALPLVLYDIPATTHMTIPVEVVERLRHHPNVVGIKDSGGDIDHLAALLARLGANRPDFAVLVGASVLSAQGLALGADGIVPSQGNLIPALCRALYDCAIAGDRDGAAAYQKQLNTFTRLFVEGRSLAQSLGALKAMMGARNLCGPDVLPPLLPPSPQEQEALQRQFMAWRAEYEHANRERQSPILLQEFVFETASFPSCHAATILELPDGELLCAFFGGTAESDPDVEIRLARKPPGGEWTAPVSVADGVRAKGDRLSTGNPVLFQPQGGDIMLFYKIFAPGSPWVGMLKTSSDGGRTWSAARPVGAGRIGPDKNKPLQLDDGAIVAGSAIEDDHGWRVHVERSTDGGSTWAFIGPLNPQGEIGVIQPAFLTHPDGRIQMLCRTRSEHGFIVQSWSGDGGLTWSPLEAAVLPNNNSGLDAVTLRDGRHLLVYNHSTHNQAGMGHKGRGILNVALSRDGASWEAALILDYRAESGKQFSYPAVIQTRDGLVHIVYTWHRERIKHVVLDPAHLATTPMPDGQWPAEGPFSLAAFKQRKSQ